MSQLASGVQPSVDHLPQPLRRLVDIFLHPHAESLLEPFQLADLRVQVPDRRLVLGVARCSAASEDILQPVDRLALPRAHLVRMNLVLGRDRLHRAVPAQRLERHAFLEVRGELPPSFRRHPSASSRLWNTP